MKHSNFLSAGCVGFLCGVLGASFFAVPTVALLVVGVVATGGLVLFLYNEKGLMACACMLFCCVGAVVLYYAQDQILEQQKLYGAGTQVEFVGKVVEDPDKRADGRVFLVVEPHHERIRHNIRITSLYQEYQHGEIVRVSGTLLQPEDFEGFEYRGWLARQGIGYVMRGDVRIEKLDMRDTSIASFLSDVKEELRDGIEDVLPPRQASFYRAILLGERGSLDSTTQERIQGAGLSHIVAISGMHIAILFFVVLFLLSALPLWRWQTSVVALCFVFLYIMMLGASASMVRALCMVSIFFIAEQFGRPHHSLRVLLLVATLMVVFNPLIMRYDIGFQLSFSAVAGILLSLPYYNKFLFFITDRLGLRSLVGVSLSAQLATLPLVLVHFGTFPVWGLIANILVVGFLPVILVVGIITMFLGMLGFAWAGGIAFILAEYVNTIALWFS